MAVMTGGGEYDEKVLHGRLERCAAEGRVAFAAGCAEWLFPSYESFVRLTGRGDAEALRSVIDAAWALARPVVSLGRAEAELLRVSAESLVPHDDDEDWSMFSPVAQNAAAAAAYAVRSWLSNDPQEAVWAARQLYEAGDYLVQLGAAEQSYVAGLDSEEPVALVTHAVMSMSEAVQTGDVNAVQRDAVVGGRQFQALWDPRPHTSTET